MLNLLNQFFWFVYLFRDKLWNPGVPVTLGGILVSSQMDMTKRKNCFRFPELPQGGATDLLIQ